MYLEILKVYIVTTANMLLLCFLVGMLLFLISVCVYLYMSGIFFTPKINIGPAPFEKILICKQNTQT